MILLLFIHNSNITVMILSTFSKHCQSYINIIIIKSLSILQMVHGSVQILDFGFVCCFTVVRAFWKTYLVDEGGTVM